MSAGKSFTSMAEYQVSSPAALSMMFSRKEKCCFQLFLILVLVGIFTISVCLELVIRLSPDIFQKPQVSQQAPQTAASQQSNQSNNQNAVSMAMAMYFQRKETRCGAERVAIPCTFVSKSRKCNSITLFALHMVVLFSSVLGSNTIDYDCQDTGGKRTFPNLGYAFKGYNILKGFPLAVGPDPGFTYPIFRPDYSKGSQTADCRNIIPLGLDITRDVSCVTSFSSQIVQTQYEVTKAISVSTTAEARLWSFSFSASAGYKEAVSTVSDEKVVLIYSTANCNYYISKLKKTKPPPFDPEFLKWVTHLNKTNVIASEQEKAKYFDFFEYYGTHYLHTVTFGASDIHEYKMSTVNYTSMREMGVDIAATASLSSQFIRVQTGFNLVESKKSVANQFLSTVQERTITKGAPPPAAGDDRTWASIVQETPIPTQYVLGSLEDLFTREYMESLGVMYDEIKTKITAYKGEYCQFLREKGLLDNCIDSVNVIILEGTEIFGAVKEKTSSWRDCHDSCQEDKSCVAMDFCKDCLRSDKKYQKCQMYTEDGYNEAESHTAMETTIWLSKIKRQLVLYNTAVIGSERLSYESNYSKSIQDCVQRCLDDEYCVIITYCNCTDKIRNCKLYTQDGIFRLKAEDGSQTHFLSNKINSVYDIYTTSKPQNLTGPN